ncbi:MAG: hypothetical protein DIZ80_16805 [endosymbiont of Galathealinum brachiosum]|uniref:Uncharacterized protein n=1 Tax=endosymbiont of Galathealinum brachiosum TaxID=2200906 RepID=A0A370D8R9_9GAMM|nr:MAG: hypothetical protein DIZ80_16805 [endosymbiont of Galathealinum brachiosum]
MYSLGGIIYYVLFFLFLLWSLKIINNVKPSINKPNIVKLIASMGLVGYSVYATNKNKAAKICNIIIF